VCTIEEDKEIEKKTSYLECWSFVYDYLLICPSMSSGARECATSPFSLHYARDEPK
jgi:hypothetical protein